MSHDHGYTQSVKILWSRNLVGSITHSNKCSFKLERSQRVPKSLIICECDLESNIAKDFDQETNYYKKE